jgi:outer membrane protein assembly factor BamB
MARRARGCAIGSVAVLAAVAAILPTAGSASAGASAPSQPTAAHRRMALAATSQDWPAYLFAARHPSTTTGPTAITLTNAGSLTAAWTFQEQPPTGNQPPGGFSASPTVAGGMVFIGSQTGDFYALQESTGQVVWTQTLDYQQPGNNGNCKNARGIVGTATVAADPKTGNPTVYVAGALHLYALDAATGAQK